VKELGQLGGLIDDKGTEYAFGNSPLSFWEPGKGFTTNILSSSYHSKLKKTEKVKDYDEMIKKYLTEEQYKVFCQKFRMNPEPNEDDINAELQWLKDTKNPASNLQITVFGETYDIHDDIAFMQYNYQPQAMGIYVESEKINIRREEQGYKDPARIAGWGKFVFIVILAVVILIAVLSSLDLSKLGNLFG
jgi:lipopolysaccharide export LptBFGC system permease protein LptF